jgi:TRAP-type mannitol/chloroaromatic compound transport system permease small subunit
MENIEIEILKKIEENNKKIDAVYESVEKTRKYFLWTAIFNIVIFVLPLIGLIFIIPWFLSTMNYSSLGL